MGLPNRLRNAKRNERLLRKLSSKKDLRIGGGLYSFLGTGGGCRPPLFREAINRITLCHDTIYFYHAVKAAIKIDN